MVETPSSQAQPHEGGRFSLRLCGSIASPASAPISTEADEVGQKRITKARKTKARTRDRRNQLIMHVQSGGACVLAPLFRAFVIDFGRGVAALGSLTEFVSPPILEWPGSITSRWSAADGG